MRNTSNSEFETIYTGSSTKFTVTGLASATTTYIKSIFKYFKQFHQWYVFCTLYLFIFSFTNDDLGPPSPPILTLSQYGRDFIVITWNSPNDGRSAIDRYVIYFSNSTDGPWNNIANITGSSLRYFIYYYCYYHTYFNTCQGIDTINWKLIQLTTFEHKHTIWHFLV